MSAELRRDPAWWRSAVVYQIYPRSFADATGDGIGDLPGIIERLDHLTYLGVDAVWISPFFRSPMADNGYDISDHRRVDPVFGDDGDAQRLIEAAHDRGLKVVLDIVLGHTSAQHPWFADSSSSRESILRDWYVWRDGPTPGSARGGPPNNWEAGFPPGASAWTWHQPTRQWYLHSHLPEQPDLDWTNPAVRAAQLDVLRWWLDQGIDGVRLDSINRLGKDPDLRDNVPAQPLRQQDWPTLHSYLRQVRRLLDEYPGVMAVGEVWEFDQRRLLPYLATDELHLAHNFVFARLPFRARDFADVVAEFEDLADDHVWPAWFLNNHDEPRVASRWSAAGEDPAHGQDRARVAATLLLTLRGTPFLYQGEELGLPDTELPAGVGNDPNGRDPQRTPIPWAPPSRAGLGAGFSTGTPWLPVGSTAETANVTTQRDDPTSMLRLYRRLLHLRRARPSLRTGRQQILRVDDDVLAYRRSEGDEHTLVTLNFGSVEHPLHDLAGLARGDAVLLVATGSDPALVSDRHLLPARSAAVWSLPPS